VINIVRKNSYKENKTPWKIIKEKNPKAIPDIPVLPTVFLDELYRKRLNNQEPGGTLLVRIPHPSPTQNPRIGELMSK
jgi:hypothetical protein